MSVSDRMRLVFRLAQIGFTLPVEELIELREGSRSWIDAAAADSRRRLLGKILHRGQPIAVLDPRPGIGLAPAPLPEQVTLLVVGPREAPRALPVDRMEGIFPGEEFVVQELPPLLRRPGQGYDTLEIWRDEPLVRVDLERILPAGSAA